MNKTQMQFYHWWILPFLNWIFYQSWSRGSRYYKPSHRCSKMNQPNIFLLISNTYNSKFCIIPGIKRKESWLTARTKKILGNRGETWKWFLIQLSAYFSTFESNFINILDHCNHFDQRDNAQSNNKNCQLLTSGCVFL